MGPKLVNEFSMLGTMVPAAEAKRLGIVNRVVPLDKLDETAMQMATQLMAKNPWGLSRIKFLNYAQAPLSIDAAMELGNTQLSLWLQLADVKEGINAFLNKRKANYEPFKGKTKHGAPGMLPLYD